MNYYFIEKTTTIVLLFVSIITTIVSFVFLFVALVPATFVFGLCIAFFILYFKVAIKDSYELEQIKILEKLKPIVSSASDKCRLLIRRIEDNKVAGYGKEKYQCISFIQDAQDYFDMFKHIHNRKSFPTFSHYFYMKNLTKQVIDTKLEECEKKYNFLMNAIKAEK